MSHKWGDIDVDTVTQMGTQACRHRWTNVGTQMMTQMGDIDVGDRWGHTCGE